MLRSVQLLVFPITSLITIIITAIIIIIIIIIILYLGKEHFTADSLSLEKFDLFHSMQIF